MAHEDAGNYRGKHDPDTPINPDIAAAVQAAAREGRISCAAAHKIAQTLQVSPADVGQTIDLLEFKIMACQLGLFGHQPQKRIVQPLGQVDRALQQALEAVQSDAGVSCLQCWEIAAKLAAPKLQVSGACETLGIKIASCQLGAFSRKK